MNNIKKVAVFTSNRSDYGCLQSIIQELNTNKNFELQLLVGGSHLSEEYGQTIDHITEDNFPIAYKLPFLYTDKGPDVHIRSISLLQSQIGTILTTDRPDMLLVLGDRFELLPVVSTALILNIPIAHISGGEVTEGAIDNQIRHAVSKMAHVHFVATGFNKDYLIRMGEEEWRICVSGEPALDIINKMTFYSKEELFHELELNPEIPTICATFHPETITNDINTEFIQNLFNRILIDTSYQIVVTAANFDEGGREINEGIEKISDKNPRVKFIKSLGQKRYYSLLKYASIMLGNSSSGIWEAQSFKIPVINIGNRQKGRIQNPNIYNTGASVEEILAAMNLVTSDDFKNLYFSKDNIYGSGKAAERIINFISDLPQDKLLLKRDVYK